MTSYNAKNSILPAIPMAKRGQSFAKVNAATGRLKNAFTGKMLNGGSFLPSAVAQELNRKRNPRLSSIINTSKMPNGGNLPVKDDNIRMSPLNISVKRQKKSDSPRFQYDSNNELYYTPDITVLPDLSSSKGYKESPRFKVDLLNPTLDEFIDIAGGYYPIDNKLVKDQQIKLPPSKYQTELEQKFVTPQMVGKTFGNLPLNKGKTIDDGYSPNRIWTTNLRGDDSGINYATKGDYAYILKGNPENLSSYEDKDKIETASQENNRFLSQLHIPEKGLTAYNIDNGIRKLPNLTWNKAEQMRVEAMNNKDIREWAKLHNYDLSNQERNGFENKDKNSTDADDRFAPKIPEAMYAKRLSNQGLVTTRPDYDYGYNETYIVQDPSQYTLAGYFPIDKDLLSFQDYTSREDMLKNRDNMLKLMSEKTGISPEQFNSGEYLIHYNRSPITEYTPGKNTEQKNLQNNVPVPKMNKGGEMIKRKDGSYSKRGLWDNIRKNRGSGKKPTKQMLQQEKKIKSMEKGGSLYKAYLDTK